MQDIAENPEHFIKQSLSQLPLHKRAFETSFLAASGGGSTPRLVLVLFLLVEEVAVQLREIQKLCQCHAEGDGDFVQGSDPGVEGLSVHKVVQRGMADAAHKAQLIDRDSPLPAQEKDSIHKDLRIFFVHIVCPAIRR